MKTYSPSQLGRLLNRTTQTLQRWDREGILIAHRTPTNRRYYTHEQYLQVIGQPPRLPKLITYSRVSVPAQRDLLVSQRSLLTTFCAAQGKAIDLQLEDVGSGLNYERKNFLALMEMVGWGEVGEIVIPQKDSLVRFGFEWFLHFCGTHNTKLTVINLAAEAPEAEILLDFFAILDSFGLRKFKKKIKQMLAESGVWERKSEPPS